MIFFNSEILVLVLISSRLISIKFDKFIQFCAVNQLKKK